MLRLHFLGLTTRLSNGHSQDAARMRLLSLPRAVTNGLCLSFIFLFRFFFFGGKCMYVFRFRFKICASCLETKAQKIS